MIINLKMHPTNQAEDQLAKRIKETVDRMIREAARVVPKGALESFNTVVNLDDHPEHQTSEQFAAMVQGVDGRSGSCEDYKTLAGAAPTALISESLELRPDFLEFAAEVNVRHASDCAVVTEPAYVNGPCTCGADDVANAPHESTCLKVQGLCSCGAEA